MRKTMGQHGRNGDIDDDVGRDPSLLAIRFHLSGSSLNDQVALNGTWGTNYQQKKS